MDGKNQIDTQRSKWIIVEKMRPLTMEEARRFIDMGKIAPTHFTKRFYEIDTEDLSRT